MVVISLDNELECSVPDGAMIKATVPAKLSHSQNYSTAELPAGGKLQTLLLAALATIKMKTLFIIAVISCLLVEGMTQTKLSPQECATQGTQLSGCVTMLGTGGGPGGNFCKNCNTQRLIEYFQACNVTVPGGGGVDTLRNSKLSCIRMNIHCMICMHR